jgi:hypothetical protein
MFGQRKRLRRLAAHVLLGWLFALTMGIVNACVLEPETRHDAAAVTQHHHDASAHTHHGSAHADKAICIKFCDEPSMGAQVLKQQQFDPFDGAWLVAAPAALPTISTMCNGAGAFYAAHGWWRPAIPIPIAFLRLTL